MSKNKFRIVSNDRGYGWIQQMSVESEAVWRLAQEQELRQELSADGELIFGFGSAWYTYPKDRSVDVIRFSPFTGEPFEFSIAARDAKLIKQRLLKEQDEEETDDGPGLREEAVVAEVEEEEEEEVEVDEEEVEVDDEDEYEYEEVEEDDEDYEYEEVEEDDDEYEEE